jgi:hypothetical protein
MFPIYTGVLFTDWICFRLLTHLSIHNENINFEKKSRIVYAIQE